MSTKEERTPKHLPEGYVEEKKSASTEGLRQEIATCMITKARIETAMKMNPDVIRADKKLKKAKEKYRGAQSEQDAMIDYCVSILRDRGEKGNKTVLDQLEIPFDEPEGEETEEGEDEGEGEEE